MPVCAMLCVRYASYLHPHSTAAACIERMNRSPYTARAETMIRTYYSSKHTFYNVTVDTRVLIAYSQNTTCRLSMTVWLMKNWAEHGLHTPETTKWARVRGGKLRQPRLSKILLLLLLFQAIKVDKFHVPINLSMLRYVSEYLFFRRCLYLSLFVCLPLLAVGLPGWPLMSPINLFFFSQ